MEIVTALITKYGWKGALMTPGDLEITLFNNHPGVDHNAASLHIRSTPEWQNLDVYLIDEALRYLEGLAILYTQGRLS